MGGPFPDREMVQRLVETHTGVISAQQYDAWVMSHARRHSGDGRDGIDHVLDHLAEGVEVGGSREKALWCLAGMDNTAKLTARVEQAVEQDLLTRAQADEVLTRALSYPPLPALVPLPEGVDPLPSDWPPPSADHVALAPGTVVHGYATMEAYREAGQIGRAMSTGELDRNTGQRMLEALKTDYVVGDSVPAPEEE